jgi:DNA-binding MarR family transcriptional regulator
MSDKAAVVTSNGFVTFFETLKKAEAETAPNAHQSTDLLRYLTTPTTVSAVALASGVSIDDLAVALKALQEAGLINVQGLSASDRINLTTMGEKLAASISTAA